MWPQCQAAMPHCWLLIVQFRLHGDRSSCSILGLGLAVQGGLPARLPALSALPSSCPAVGAASSTPSRCPQALPGWAQESVFTNTIHMAPGAPWLCPEDVRPRAPGGGPGARLSVAQGNQAGRLLPRPASTTSLQAGLQGLGSGAPERPSPKCSYPSPACFTTCSHCAPPGRFSPSGLLWSPWWNYPIQHLHGHKLGTAKWE